MKKNPNSNATGNAAMMPKCSSHWRRETVRAGGAGKPEVWPFRKILFLRALKSNGLPVG